MKKLAAVLVVYAIAAGCLGAGGVAVAQSHTGHGATAATKGTGTATGEVRRIDKEGKKLVIKHGDIKGMDMPGMTMAFPVKDPKMLDAVKPGDKISFVVEKAGDDLVVTRIDKEK